MTVRAVEGKKPYTGGKAIEIDEDKVISLKLRDENNLIIWDEGDNEIYVDLQLDDEIRPTDAFPVGITTGRVIIDNGWDKTGTLICAKTTSGDNIKIFYSDDGHLYVDHGTGLFTQVYLKPEVDALLSDLRTYVDTELAKKQDKLIAGDNIEIAQDGKTISAVLPPLNRFLSLWNCSTGMPISFPTSTLPFEYESGDHFLVETVDSTTNYKPSGTEYDGTASQTVETADVQPGDVYIYDGSQWLLQVNHDKVVTFAQIAGQPSDNTNLATALNAKQDTLTAGNGISIDANDEISVDTSVIATQTDLSNGLANKQDTLTAGQNIAIDQNNEISVDYSWTTITISSGSATLTDTRCKLIPTGNFTLQAPSTVSEGQEYVLRCENTTAYTMTLGIGFTNPHNVDLTLSANATDQFIFLATPSGQLELQPAQLGAGTGISIANGDINVDTTVIATKADLSNYVELGNNTLSSPSFVSGSYSSGGIDYTSTLDADKLNLEATIGNIQTDLTLNGNAIIRTRDNNGTITTETFGFIDGDLPNKIARLKDIPSYTASTGISINANNEISNTLPGAIKSSTAPSNPSQGDQWYDTTNDELKIYDGSAWNAVGGGGDVGVSTQANNVFTPGMKIWGGTSANYANLTPDGNTAYLII